MTQEISTARLLLTEGNTVFMKSKLSILTCKGVELQDKVLQSKFYISYVKEYLRRKYGNGYQ